MKRLLIITGAAVGACAIAVPAAAGLAGNPSFSEKVAVRVPHTARAVSFDDHGHAVERSKHDGDRREHAKPAPASSTHVTPTAHPSSTAHPEPGDDRGTHTEPGDDRTSTVSASATHRSGSDDAGASPSSHGSEHRGSDDGAHTGHGGHGGDD